MLVLFLFTHALEPFISSGWTFKGSPTWMVLFLALCTNSSGLPSSLFFPLFTVTKSVMLRTFRISKTSKRFVTSFPQSRDYLPPLPSQPEFKTSPLHPSPVPYDNSAAQQEPHQYHHLKHHQSQHLCYPPTLARRHHLP